MFALEERRGNVYAMYDFTLDELEWLIDFVPQGDDFAKEMRRAINELKQVEFDRAETLRSLKK